MKIQKYKMKIQKYTNTKFRQTPTLSSLGSVLKVTFSKVPLKYKKYKY